MNFTVMSIVLVYIHIYMIFKNVSLQIYFAYVIKTITNGSGYKTL